MTGVQTRAAHASVAICPGSSFSIEPGCLVFQVQEATRGGECRAWAAVTVLQRKVRGRVQFTNRIGCSRLIPRSRQAESARRGVYQRGDVGKNQLGNVTP